MTAREVATEADRYDNEVRGGCGRGDIDFELAERLAAWFNARVSRRSAPSRVESDGPREAHETPWGLCNDCRAELTRDDGFTHCAACRHRADREHARACLDDACRIASSIRSSESVNIDSLDPFTREDVEAMLAAAASSSEGSETDQWQGDKAPPPVSDAHAALLDLILSKKWSGASLQRAIHALIEATRAAASSDGSDNG